MDDCILTIVNARPMTDLKTRNGPKEAGTHKIGSQQVFNLGLWNGQSGMETLTTRPAQEYCGVRIAGGTGRDAVRRKSFDSDPTCRMQAGPRLGGLPCVREAERSTSPKWPGATGGGGGPVEERTSAET